MEAPPVEELIMKHPVMPNYHGVGLGEYKLEHIIEYFRPY